ncbi:hypothetical protein [Clostridium fungisolvens]|uniref:Uncharacterized protein n=1 Tax=Clostridium fungisolvens TaxID=1604897 RepID=A0A6V8SHG6_9CLOT|nr:hypothetical protein [Clostridium fungisolvens]GFP76664.1 hypothetical protein bsdtw1_02767 [Clostridium fungisolvens]
MKTKNAIAILFPSIIMMLITVFSFSNDRMKEYDKMGLLILALLLIFPILFAIQGVIIGKMKLNVFLSLGISAAVFTFLSLICLNSSALFYCVIYLPLWGLGYLFGRWFYGKSKV